MESCFCVCYGLPLWTPVQNCSHRTSMRKQKSRQNWHIRESPSQFENQIMPRVYIRSITGSTMYQKSSILFAGNGVWKISSVSCGFSCIKIDCRINLIHNRLFCCDHNERLSCFLYFLRHRVTF